MVTATAWTTQMKAIAPAQQQSLLALVVNALALKVFVIPNQTAKMAQTNSDVVRNAETKQNKLLTLYLKVSLYSFHVYENTGMSWSKDKFSCASGSWISWALTCNGEKNCEDGADEPFACSIFPGYERNSHSCI